MMNSTLARITTRGLFGRRRFLLLLPLPAVLVGIAVLAAAYGADSANWLPGVAVGLGLAVVLPVVALIVGASVLGSEIDDGTVVHILAKPLPRSQIVLTKLAVAVGVTAATVGSAMFVVGLLGGSVRLGLGLLAAAVVGSLAYGAVFLLLSLVTRRPVLFGLVYVLIWEGLLSNLLDGTRVLSIQQYAVTVADRVSDSPALTGTVPLPVALVMTGLITIGATVLAVDRLRSFSVAGETS